MIVSDHRASYPHTEDIRAAARGALVRKGKVMNGFVRFFNGYGTLIPYKISCPSGNATAEP